MHCLPLNSSERGFGVLICTVCASQRVAALRVCPICSHKWPLVVAPSHAMQHESRAERLERLELLVGMSMVVAFVLAIAVLMLREVATAVL